MAEHLPDVHVAFRERSVAVAQRQDPLAAAVGTAA